MTPDEALQWLKVRAQSRCDRKSVSWSLTDVMAVRALVAEADRAEAVLDGIREWLDEPLVRP